jgi:ABC-2 type transport system permease protein
VKNLIRSEWIKLRSVRSTLVMLIAAGVLTVLFAVLIANDQNSGPSAGFGNLGDVIGGVQFAIFLFGTLGVQIIGQEYRFNTIRPTFTAAPWRMRVLVAKLVVIAGSAALVTVAMLAISALVGSLMLDRFEIDGVDQRIIWATILFSMGWTMYGMALGAIVRQPIAAIVILLIQGLVAEPLLATLLKWTGPWMPFQNGIQMTQRSGDPDLFRSIFAGGVYFFAFTFVLWGIGAFLVNRRDA